MCILEVLIYELHYDFIKNKYDNKSKVLFTDADNLIYEIPVVLQSNNLFELKAKMY